MPPVECPARTYGGRSPARSSTVCRSSAAATASCGSGAGSLHPWPARSKAQTRVPVEVTAFVTLAQSAELPPSPLDSTTVGRLVWGPRQSRCSDRSPMSYSSPGADWAVTLATSWTTAPTAAASSATRTGASSRRPRRGRALRAARHDHTTSAATGSGQAQATTSIAAAPGAAASSATPVDPEGRGRDGGPALLGRPAADQRRRSAKVHASPTRAGPGDARLLGSGEDHEHQAQSQRRTHGDRAGHDPSDRVGPLLADGPGAGRRWLVWVVIFMPLDWW